MKSRGQQRPPGVAIEDDFDFEEPEASTGTFRKDFR
jgi:hypothetical protein